MMIGLQFMTEVSTAIVSFAHTIPQANTNCPSAKALRSFRQLMGVQVLNFMKNVLQCSSSRLSYARLGHSQTLRISWFRAAPVGHSLPSG